MKYVSGWIVWGIYTELSWSGEVEEPIGSSVPVGAGSGVEGRGWYVSACAGGIIVVYDFRNVGS